jgi:hypothetical protein
VIAPSRFPWNQVISPCIHTSQPCTGHDASSSASRWALAAQPWAWGIAIRIPYCSPTRNADIAAAGRLSSSRYAEYVRSRISTVSSG